MFQLKMDARAKIKAAKPPHYAATIVYLVIVFVITWLNRELSARFDPFIEAFYNGTPFPPFTDTLFYSQLFISILSLILSFITVGYAWYTLRLSRLIPSGFSNLFDTFNMPVKVVCLTIVINVLTYLWTLLFIIPGIIASYRYRQAHYILFDHPDYSIMQCIKESSEIMKGRKLELFILDLSFFGWVLLGILTLGIIFIWTMPYYYVTCANYYNSLTASFIQGEGGSSLE